MANNKMLIDASHPEETRVVVIRGNRIEEFDFEAQERKQLRGNIYLAKVTRVEPSLQAAFIDYGGNRHGFLAFSEIHPDYYQIPAADRQALLAEEEAAAAAAAKAEEEEDSLVILEEEQDSDEEDGDSPKKSRRRRGGRSRRKSAQSDDRTEDSDDDRSDDADDEDENVDAVETASQDDGVEEVEEAKKPAKRARNTRSKRKTARSADTESDDTESGDAETEEAASEDDSDAKPKKKAARKPARPRRKKATDSDGGGEGDSEKSDGGSQTMAAMMDVDTISEPAPEDDGPQDDDDQDTVAADASGDDEKPAKPKRKPRAPRRKKAAKAETGDEETFSEEPAGSADEDASAIGSDTPDADDSDDEGMEASGSENGETADEDGEPRRKGRRSRRRRGGRKDEDSRADEDTVAAESGEGATQVNGNGNGAPVESVGQEDALEEARIKRPRRQYKIQEVIRRRQVMLVQVVKEERGNKGAALTTYLSLAGRYSVLMPNTARGGGISRKITNPADRKRLKEIAQSLDVPKGMGVILRTAGASQDSEEIQRDFDYLMRLWDNVRNLTLASTAPFLVYEEGSLIKRSIRDLYNRDISEVVVAGEAGYREARDFMTMLMPEHARNVKHYHGDQPIFSRFGVENQLEKMVSQQVTLKSGGYLIINQTEALVAIDVNSGKSTREHSIEATALQTNLEAAEEVARQLRLRDLAGLIVIDFIDMEEKRNNRAVERKLKDCLKRDRARIQVGHISHFGLLEMSRQRIRASVLESTMEVCPVCSGVGHVRSRSSLALMVLRSLEDYLNRNNRNDVTVRVAPSMAFYILNNKRRSLSEMESRYGLQITVEAGHDIDSQDHEFVKGERATGDPDPMRAIGMMHDTQVQDDSAGDTAEEEMAETASSGDDEEDRSGRRGRRRRGRGRGRDRDNGNDRDNRSARGDHQVDDEDEDDDGVSTSVDNGQDEKAKSAARRMDRDHDGDAVDEPEERSSNKQGRASATHRQAEASAKQASGATAKAVAEPAEVKESDGPARPSRPQRQTGRPGKKVRAEEDKAASADSNGEAGQDAASDREGAPPREVKRRNTRRVSGSSSGAAENAETANSDEGGEAESGAGWSGFLS